MTKDDILREFHDINSFYNDCMKYDTLSNMLDKLMEETVTEFADRCRECGKITNRCKNCKYFEYDSVAKVNWIPIIVAHEICSKWGNGCKTDEDGYCFLFEKAESEGETEVDS